MPCPAQDRLRVLAVINALKVAGIRVKNWKNYLDAASPNNDTLRKESRYKFAFGRDLSLLPQCHVEDAGGTVSMFLVDACEFLSHHLHTEGLFRKTGSLSRIRSLRAGLEQGHLVFSRPYPVTLQPCDVATLLKQFLRELPSPLIPMDLQGPLCLAQCLEEEEESGQKGSRDEATLLLTALFPPTHTRALRYLCTFLRQAAERSNENRMEVGNLALVIAPNLLQCPAGGAKLTAGTERQLDRQAAVIKALITNADRIGAVPSSVLSMPPVVEGEASVPPAEGGRFQERSRLGVYRSLRRQRRRSVGEIFVDALSKLKTGLTPAGPSNSIDSHQNGRSPTPQSPATTKRKSTEDPTPDVQGSAKKRRSIQDLRENNQPVKQCSDDSEASVGQSHSCSSISVLSGLEGGREQEACVTLNAAEKKRNQKIDSKIYNRLTAEEDKAQRRRTLRFFNMATWNNNPNAGGMSIGSDPENWMTESKKLNGAVAEVSVSEGDGSAPIPFILIEGPGRGVAEDDCDLLDYSVVEMPSDPTDSPGSPSGVESVKQGERATLGDEDGSDEQDDIGRERGSRVKTEVKCPAGETGPDKSRAEAEVSGRVSQKPRRPRRSLSMPEVSLIHMSGHGDAQADGPEAVWPVRAEQETRPQQERPATPGDAGVGKERRDRAESKRREKKEKQAESGRVPHRMSVADRLRRFNTLAMLLRTPRAPVPPPEPLLQNVLHGTVRLRRQGARRFGRSISHDGVPLEPDSVDLQGEEEEEPEEFQPTRQTVQSAPSETTTTPHTSHVKPDLKRHPAREDPSQQENILPTTPTQPPQQTQGRQEELPERPRRPEEPSKDTDLHNLLQMRLNLCDPEQPGGNDASIPEQLDRQTQTDATIDVPQQMVDLQVREDHPFLPTPLSMHLYMKTCSLTFSIATQTDRATPQESCHNTLSEATCSPDRISALDLIAGDMDRCSRSLDISPPALAFRSPASRRRYRDSPRWHVHEISMATGDPLHI